MRHHSLSPTTPFGISALGIFIIALLTRAVVADDQTQPQAQTPDARAGAADKLDELDQMTDDAVDTVGGPVPDNQRHNHGHLTVYFENDLFGGGDQDYTNGTRLSWLSENLPDGALPDVSRWLRNTFDFDDADNLRLNYGFSLQQLMFTPSDLSASEVIRNDRPYAGWTALGASLHAKTLNTVRSLELSVGVIGESSYAEDIQDWVHDWRDSPKAQGWDNQLHDELAINLFFESQHRFLTDRSFIPGVEMDLLPRHGIALGNVLTAADLGIVMRAGYNLPENFGNQKLGPTAYNQEIYYDDQGRRIHKGDFSCYLFFGGNARAKAWDIFLDGNTTGDSHSVDKNYLVAELEAGIGLRYRDIHLTYTHTFRSEEFRNQEDPPQFGSLAITIPF